MAVEMKWYIIDADEAPIYWHEGDENAAMMEFDTLDDAVKFIQAAREIPFVEAVGWYPWGCEQRVSGSRNYTGLIPKQNGDSIDLVRR